MNLLHRRVVERNYRSVSMTPKARAQALHPSRLNEGLDELLPLVKNWAAEPSSIDAELQAEETGEAMKARARLEALRRRIDQIGDDVESPPADEDA